MLRKRSRLVLSILLTLMMLMGLLPSTQLNVLAANPTVPYFDDFSYPTGTKLSDDSTNWGKAFSTSPIWTVKDSVYLDVATSSKCALYSKTAGEYTDSHVASADIRMLKGTTSTEGGLAVRINPSTTSSSKSAYRFLLKRDDTKGTYTPKITKVVSNSEITIPSTSITTYITSKLFTEYSEENGQAWINLKLELIENADNTVTLKGYVDGELAVVFNDSSSPYLGDPNASYVGLQSSAQTSLINYDNFFVGSVFPAAPASLTAVAGNSQVALSWPVTSGKSYNIYRALNSGGPYTHIASDSSGSYTDSAVVNGTQYFYAVRTVESINTSAGNKAMESVNASASATPNTVAIPSAPATLTASLAGNTVNLLWADSGTVSYSVYRKVNNASSFTFLKNVSGLSTTDDGLTDGNKYTYEVAAVSDSDPAVLSPFSQAAAVTLKPAVPTGLIDAAGTPLDGRADLSWTASNGTVAYSVYSSATSGGPYTLLMSSVTGTSYSVTGLQNAVPVFFVVTAGNAGGNSDYSNEVCIIPQAAAGMPAIPAGLSYTANGTNVTLSWNTAAGASSYNIYEVAGSSYNKLNSSMVTGTTYSLTGLGVGTYTFVVTAVNSIGESGYSIAVTVTTVPIQINPSDSSSTINGILSAAKPGDIITFADGSYGSSISISNLNGTADKPITIKAANKQLAKFIGSATINFENCSYIVVDGFDFIQDNININSNIFRIKNCNNIRITNNAFHLQKTGGSSTTWLMIDGANSHNNRVDNNIFENKKDTGKFIVIGGDNPGFTGISQYDVIENNTFRNTLERQVNESEPVRIGESKLSMYYSYTTVKNNVFERCDSDPEIVSVKSCGNTIANNTFKESLGSLSLRHGNNSVVYGNKFLGNGRTGIDASTSKTIGTGGIRVYGENHKIYNNYFEGLTGTIWDAAITITNGDADNAVVGGTNLDSHFIAKNITIVNNTMVNNQHSIELGYDNTGKYSRAPIGISFINNLVTGSVNELIKVINQPASINFLGNIMYPQTGAVLATYPLSSESYFGGLTEAQIKNIDPMLIKLGDFYKLSASSPAINTAVGDYSPAGTYAFVQKDFEDEQRLNNMPDVGADEYNINILKNNVPPSQNFDFSHWKITLPILNDAGTGAKEIQVPEMMAGYTSEYFYTDTDGAMTFWCPTIGATTSNTSYSRSELREMLDPADNKVNWTWEGTHILNLSEAVTRVPSTGKTIVAQIHGIYPDGSNANPLIKMLYDDTKKAVIAQFKNGTSSTAQDELYYFNNIGLNQIFETQIKVVNGVIYVTLNGETASYDFVKADPTWKDLKFYYKAGNYCQDKDGENEGAIVKIYSLNSNHSSATANVPVLGLTMNSSLTLQVGAAVTLEPVFAPADATNKNLTWSVVGGSNNIAVVSSNGTVTAVGIGTVQIKAVSAENPGIYAVCDVTVIPATVPADPTPLYSENFGISAPVPLNTDTGSSIYWRLINSAATTSSTMDVSDDGTGNYALKVTDIDAANSSKAVIVFPAQSNTMTISFKVRIDADPLYNTNKKISTAYFAVGGADLNSSANEEFKIKNSGTISGSAITDRRYVSNSSGSVYDEFALNPNSARFNLGEWHTITMITTPHNGSATSDTTDVYIDGVKVGDKLTHKLSTTTSFNQFIFYSGTADTPSYMIDDVKVYSGAVIPTSGVFVPVTAVSMDSSRSMVKGETFQLSPAIQPVDATNHNVTFSIIGGGTDVIAVSSGGLVTAVGTGTATVRATSVSNSGVYAECVITVTETQGTIEVTSVTLDKQSASIGVNGTLQLNAMVLPGNATDKSVEFTIQSGTDVVSVSAGGLVTGLKAGTAIVRAHSTSKSSVYDECTIIVSEQSQANLILAENFGTTAPIALNTSSSSLPYWSITTPTQSEVGVADDGTGNYALKIYDGSNGSSSSTAKAWLKFTPQSSTTTMKFNIMVESDEVSGGKPSASYAAFGAGSISSSANEMFKFKSWGDLGTDGTTITNRRFQYNNIVSGTSTYNEYTLNSEKAKFELGQWHSVTLISTPNDGSAYANTTDVYIDGYKVGDKLANKRADAIVEGIIFQAGTLDITKFWIDNIEIYSGAVIPDVPQEPDTTAPVVTLTTVDQTVGSSVTSVNLTGILSEGGKVTVKNKGVTVTDAVYYPAGDFSISVNLSLGQNKLEITAVDEAGNSSDMKTVTISRTASSNGGPVYSEPPKTTVNVDSNGNIQLTLSSNASDTAVNAVKFAVDSATIDKALQKSKAITIDLPKAENTNAYALQLPGKTLTQTAPSSTLTIKTNVATLTVPDNMLSNAGLANAKDITLRVGTADTSKLDSVAKAQIGNKPVIDLQVIADGKTVAYNNSQAPVKVTIPYKPTAEELKQFEHIVVYYIDGNGKLVTVSNAKYDTATGTVIFTTTHFSQYAVSYVVKNFTDLTGYDWAKKQIEVMAAKGIINGTSNDSYSPASNITRADFIKLLVTTLELKADVDGNFGDVKSTDYYYQSVGIARKLGIVKGTGADLFAPDTEITRQEMMVMTARALKLVKKLNTTGSATDLAAFNDKDKVSDYAVDDTASLIKDGIIQGSGSSIEPVSNTTRAEAAVLMYRIYNK